MIFLFTFVTFNQQTADLEKKSYSLEWPAYQDKRVEGPNIVHILLNKLAIEIKKSHFLQNASPDFDETLWDCIT